LPKDHALERRDLGRARLEKCSFPIARRSNLRVLRGVADSEPPPKRFKSGTLNPLYRTLPIDQNVLKMRYRRAIGTTQKARDDMQGWRQKLHDFGTKPEAEGRTVENAADSDLNKAWAEIPGLRCKNCRRRAQKTGMAQRLPSRRRPST
jgi:hypothetical protein